MSTPQHQQSAVVKRAPAKDADIAPTAQPNTQRIEEPVRRSSTLRQTTRLIASVFTGRFHLRRVPLLSLFPRAPVPRRRGPITAALVVLFTAGIVAWFALRDRTVDIAQSEPISVATEPTRTEETPEQPSQPAKNDRDVAKPAQPKAPAPSAAAPDRTNPRSTKTDTPRTPIPSEKVGASKASPAHPAAPPAEPSTQSIGTRVESREPKHESTVPSPPANSATSTKRWGL